MRKKRLCHCNIVNEIVANADGWMIKAVTLGEHVMQSKLFTIATKLLRNVSPFYIFLTIWQTNNGRNSLATNW